MTATAIAYRIACAPVEQLGGSNAQYVALIAAVRWAAPDGRFILRQVMLQAATGLSERPISAAVKALQSAKVFVPLGVDEWLIATEHLHRIGGQSLPFGGSSLLGCDQCEAAGPAEKDARTSFSGNRAPPGRSRPGAAGASESDAGPAEKEVGAATGTKSVISLTDVSASSPSSEEFEKEEEDARAGEDGEDADAAADGTDEIPGESSGWEPSESEARTLAWINASGLPWTLPNGTDLRREWVLALRFLKPKECEQVRQRMAGDTPTAFRKAMGADLVAVREQRAVAAAEAAHVARAQATVDDERAREVGSYLERARVLLGQIESEDARREKAERAMGWVPAVRDLRAAVDKGRVSKTQLLLAEWPA